MLIGYLLIITILILLVVWHKKTVRLGLAVNLSFFVLALD